MTRRGLIGALIGAATLDPERLLWVPGAKVISIPKPVVAGNLFLTPYEFAQMYLNHLNLELRFHKHAFAMVYPKIGDTIHVRKPARFCA